MLRMSAHVLDIDKTEEVQCQAWNRKAIIHFLNTTTHLLRLTNLSGVENWDGNSWKKTELGSTKSVVPRGKGGLHFFSFKGGGGAEHTLGPQNPLKSCWFLIC